MKIWIPVCRRADSAVEGVDAFGGRPSAFPAGRWPICARCGSRQTLLARFWHAPDRLDLGRDAALHIFQCLSTPDCPSWKARAGSNEVIVLDADLLATAPAQPPAAEAVLAEYLIDHYREGEDYVELEQHAAFLSEATYAALEDDVRESVFDGTKLAGLPAWLQDANQHPGVGWRLAVQLTEFLEVKSAAGLPPGKLHSFGGRTSIDWGANFGMGVAWVFLPLEPRPSSGLMLWQC